MKKARKYAEEYRDNPTNETLEGIARSFHEEIKEVVTTRSVQSLSSLCAVLKEQDRKWRAFVRLAGDSGIRTDGFKRIIQGEHYLLYAHCWPARERPTFRKRRL